MIWVEQPPDLLVIYVENKDIDLYNCTIMNWNVRGLVVKIIKNVVVWEISFIIIHYIEILHREKIDLWV